MKIGIFGDSWAHVPELKFLQPWQEFMASAKSWPEYLSSSFDVTNHAISGSSLYYSLQQYKKARHDYDKKIFLVTYPGRLTISDRWKEYIVLNDNHLNGINTAEEKLNFYKNWDHPNKNIAMKIFKAAVDYFLYIADDTYDDYIHRLMLKDLENIADKDTLVIPVTKQTNSSDFCLEQVYYLENKCWNHDVTNSDHIALIDARRCHMTNENNYVLYEKIKKWIETNEFNLSLDDFIRPTLENKRSYIRPAEFTF